MSIKTKAEQVVDVKACDELLKSFLLVLEVLA